MVWSWANSVDFFNGDFLNTNTGNSTHEIPLHVRVSTGLKNTLHVDANVQEFLDRENLVFA